ncbi:hypothetical protein Clacol_000465 [Clathrus columnatus]|uniref:AB hydrolase-1 domain-containing protein n=1 Tax=Clathrus columnatus TaxID=1419009 RepID=A0AAV4ZZ48_9AGAM|nr:hypothetical protein Clacol_000465 [Clathrus columnatus]
MLAMQTIRAQYIVLTEKLGVKKVHCVLGFSMGGQQIHNHVLSFIEGPKAALLASRDFNFGHYTAPPTSGIRAFGRWFREHQYKFDGKFRNLEDFMRGSWEARFLRWDANDLITLFETWTKADISLIRDNGNLEEALKSIQVKGLIMPCKTDLYFPPEDSENEVSLLPNSKLVVIDSVWGHQAGGGASLKDNKFLEEQIGLFITEAL